MSDLKDDPDAVLFANEMLELMVKSSRIVGDKVEITITPEMVESALRRVTPTKETP